MFWGLPRAIALAMGPDDSALAATVHLTIESASLPFAARGVGVDGRVARSFCVSSFRRPDPVIEDLYINQTSFPHCLSFTTSSLLLQGESDND